MPDALLRFLQDVQPLHERKPAGMVRDVPVYVHGPKGPVLTVHHLTSSRKHLWCGARRIAFGVPAGANLTWALAVITCTQ